MYFFDKNKSGLTPAPADSGSAADGTLCFLPSCAIITKRSVYLCRCPLSQAVGRTNSEEKMDKRLSIIMIVGSIFLAIILLGLGILVGRSLYEPKTVVLNTDGEQNSSSTTYTQTENTITVVGESILNVKPEVALINLGIETCDADPRKLNLQINDTVVSLSTALQKAGLDKDSIVPSDFTLYPRYDNGQIYMYCGTNQVEVTTSNLNQVSSIIDTAIAAGANNVYGVNFTAKNMESIRQQGIQLAFQDAENQAQSLAKSMNVSIHGVVSSNIDLSGALVGAFVGYSGGGGAVEPQDSSLTVRVTVVYSVGK
jgi:uncharacterized protein